MKVAKYYHNRDEHECFSLDRTVILLFRSRKSSTAVCVSLTELKKVLVNKNYGLSFLRSEHPGDYFLFFNYILSLKKSNLSHDDFYFLSETREQYYLYFNIQILRTTVQIQS